MTALATTIDSASPPRPAPELVTISAGSFWMGADDADDKFASVVETPRHLVRIDKPFAISRFPVTFDEWDAYAVAVPGAHRADDGGWGRGRLPIINVSWNDAIGYLDWLSRTTGQRFRLPSEAEWEYCCRAGGDGVFAAGSRLSVDHANYLYSDFRERPGVGRPVAVGSYPPNAFGLFDMHGNVCELVADAWHDNYAGAPADGSARLSSPDHPWRVVRNGGWDALPRILRCAFRDWVHVNHRTDNTGFRVACDLT